MPYKDKEKQRQKNREYQKKHYESNKEYYITKAREGKKKLREEFEEYKKTLECSICGENHPATLDFHHTDPTKKEIIISKAVGRNWGWESLNREIEKCIILCSNCHRKLHYEENIAGGR
jgi:predicted HNH restriction endonuclease